MSTTQSKETLVRLSWLTELRRQGDRQCTDLFQNNGMVCALGLLREVAMPDMPDWARAKTLETVEDVGACAGLSFKQSYEVAQRNDGNNRHRKHTFAEIADVVGGWFPNG